jgi:hypothetical protein
MRICAFGIGCAFKDRRHSRFRRERLSLDEPKRGQLVVVRTVGVVGRLEIDDLVQHLLARIIHE